MMDVHQIIKKSKADFLQVNFLNGVANKVLFENGNVRDFSKVNANSASVSVWIGKKHGIAVDTIFSEDLVKKAIQIAKVSEDLEFFYGLPQEKKPVFVKGLCGREKTEGEIIESAKSLVVDLNKEETMPRAVLEYSLFTNRIVNSLGLDLEEKGSLFDAEVEYLINDKNVVSYGDCISARKIPSFKKISDFSKRVLDESRELRNPIKLEKFPEVVILSYNALAQLLDSVFLGNFNGLNVLKKKSILDGKEGEKLFSDKLSIMDSGVLERGVGSQSFDGEGTSTQETPLIEKGIVKNFLYDYNTAKHLNKKSTGNSTGRSIGSNNLIVGNGKGIELDKALVIKEIIGANTCNELTTEFSVKSFGTLLVEKGEKKAVKDVMINGRVMEILKNIVGIGKTIRNVGDVYLPEIAFKGINVANL